MTGSGRGCFSGMSRSIRRCGGACRPARPGAGLRARSLPDPHPDGGGPGGRPVRPAAWHRTPGRKTAPPRPSGCGAQGQLDTGQARAECVDRGREDGLHPHRARGDPVTSRASADHRVELFRAGVDLAQRAARKLCGRLAERGRAHRTSRDGPGAGAMPDPSPSPASHRRRGNPKHPHRRGSARELVPGPSQVPIARAPAHRRIARLRAASPAPSSSGPSAHPSPRRASVRRRRSACRAHPPLIRETPPVGMYVLNMFRMRGSRLWGSRLHRACVV